MKKVRVLAYLLNLYSMSAAAGYECQLKLAHVDDLYKTVARKTVSIGTSEMSAGFGGTILVESKRGKNINSLEIGSVMSGWKGDEDAMFVIHRRIATKHSTRSTAISEEIRIKGNDVVTSWFDNYMLDIKCETK